MTTSVMQALTSRVDAAIANQAPYLDPWARAVQGQIASAIAQTGPYGQKVKVKDALHGVWLGHALHPTLTDVPSITAANEADHVPGNDSASSSQFTR